ncbi:hypothetical protein ACWGH5_39160 [Streptomyces sp. NPDC054864]
MALLQGAALRGDIEWPLHALGGRGREIAGTGAEQHPGDLGEVLGFLRRASQAFIPRSGSTR